MRPISSKNSTRFPAVRDALFRAAKILPAIGVIFALFVFMGADRG